MIGKTVGQKTKVLFISLIFASLCGCNSDTGVSYETLDSASIHNNIPDSPPLSPEQSMNTFQLDEGLSVGLVAAEPLISSPVAIDFDNKGRIWVVELNGYMPNVEGEGENIPTGNIKILEDLDDDGHFDSSKLFLDSLVLPRAIRLVYDGILYAEPPYLYFAEVKNDQPVNRVVVDSSYAVGGNIEHQPNGLLIGLDNWIYNAKSTKRYKRNPEGNWLIEKTEFRGQWGITKDNYGRLFYNDNSNQFRGDYYAPGSIANSGISGASGIGVQIVENQKVYPARTNTGINRGYLPDMLDDSLRLTRFTAASGPLVYRGNNLPEKYRGHSFVPEPAGNLIKFNMLNESDSGLYGVQAYTNKEFLSSTDERFRPVNLVDGPDGSLYIVDFYRGIIQHKTYVTDYLREEIKRRDLEKPITLGRIYKIYTGNRVSNYNNFTTLSDKELIKLLNSNNGWVRDRAQQILVNRNSPNLKELLLSEFNPLDSKIIPILHVLWILEGTNNLNVEYVEKLFDIDNSLLKMNLFFASESILNGTNSTFFLNEIEKTVLYSNYHLESITRSIKLLKRLIEYDKKKAFDLTSRIYNEFKNNELITDLLIANLSEYSVDYIKYYPHDSLLTTELSTLSMKKMKAEEKDLKKLKGKSTFQSICAQCHGKSGEGIKYLGPPLVNSEWIKDDTERLIKVLLYGLEGPIVVNGKEYDRPEVSGIMPGLINNAELDESEISDLVNYLLDEFADKEGNTTAEDIGNVMIKFKDQYRPFKASSLQ